MSQRSELYDFRFRKWEYQSLPLEFVVTHKEIAKVPIFLYRSSAKTA